MESSITIVQLEKIINALTLKYPPENHSLRPELRLLAGVYGKMIFERAQKIELATLEPDVVALIAQEM